MKRKQPVRHRQFFIFLGQIFLGLCLSVWIGLRFSPAVFAAFSPGNASTSSGLSHDRIAALTEKAPDSTSIAPSEPLEQGRAFYQAGRFSEAVLAWQSAASAYETQRNGLNQALALSYLALAYQQLGQLTQANEAIATSSKLVQSSPDSAAKPILAQALNTQGSLQLAQGQADRALLTWQQAALNYAQAGDETGKVGSLVNQAKAQQALGFYLQARKTLTQVEQQLQSQSNLEIKVTGLQALGDVLRSLGDLSGSRQALEQGLALAIGNPAQDPSAILLSLGNTARLQPDLPAALKFYQQAADQSTSATTKVQAQLNQLSLLLETQKWSVAEALQPEIRTQISKLPLSRSTVYAEVNWVQHLVQLKQHNSSGSLTWEDIAQISASSVQHARSLGDPRAEAYAIGNLGGLYEKTNQWAEAQSLTQKALVLAQSSNAPDIAYQWQWQLGRLLKAEAERGGANRSYEGAIAAYTEAVNGLKTLRNDLVAVNSDVQFSFRDSVEPVYRQLVGLLLQPGAGEASQQRLKQAREVIESLQLAQLDNFFQEACLDARAEQIDRVDAAAAVLYSIVLEDRLEVILSLPNRPLRHYATTLPQAEVEALITRMNQSLRRTSATRDRLQVAREVYNLLLKPAEVELAESGIKTLVFVLDGALQTLPMAALYDGKQYLMEKYSIALAPGLQLLRPQPLVREKLKVLVGGLSQSSQGFTALPGVEFEIKQITSAVTSQVLLNQTFTSKALQDQIKAVPFPIVHLATHGQFSSNAKDTFILAWDSPIQVKQLGEVLQTRDQRTRTPIELLILSACQTAVGDKRAALGLAGVAVRSGARSTLATLWSVDDESTSFLMARFYHELAQAKTTKAEALRQAQLDLQKQPGFKHPYYWAPFVLVGNWL